MSANYLSTALLILNDVPIVFRDGFELASIQQAVDSRVDDKKGYDWEKTTLPKTNYTLQSFIHPVFTGLTLLIYVHPEKMNGLYPFIKAFTDFAYTSGINALSHVAFFSPLYYIMDGYIASSSISSQASDNRIQWNLTIKSKPIASTPAI